MLVLPQRELLFWEDINANGWEEVVNRRKFAMVHHFLRHRVHKSLICQGGSTKSIPMPRRSVLMNRAQAQSHALTFAAHTPLRCTTRAASPTARGAKGVNAERQTCWTRRRRNKRWP